MDNSSNSIWLKANNYDDWELSRPELFRKEKRDLFFDYFRMSKSDCVLDGGCATGVLTRFIAGGLTEGNITGFDISSDFVEYGNNRIVEEGLNDKAKIVQEDGFALSFEDNKFDTIISHNYLGVLSDPEAGLRELIRVCKYGGNISISASTRNQQTWKGDYPIEGIEKLDELIKRHEEAYRKSIVPTFKQSTYWNLNRYPKLFAECGLKNITINPVASGFAYNDKYWDKDFIYRKIMVEIGREIELYEEQMDNADFYKNGFSKEDFESLIELLRRKQDYLLNNIDVDQSWEWTASLHFIITGTK